MRLFRRASEGAFTSKLGRAFNKYKQALGDRAAYTFQDFLDLLGTALYGLEEKIEIQPDGSVWIGGTRHPSKGSSIDYYIELAQQTVRWAAEGKSWRNVWTLEEAQALLAMPPDQQRAVAWERYKAVCRCEIGWINDANNKALSLGSNTGVAVPQLRT